MENGLKVYAVFENWKDNLQLRHITPDEKSAQQGVFNIAIEQGHTIPEEVYYEEWPLEKVKRLTEGEVRKILKDAGIKDKEEQDEMIESDWYGAQRAKHK